MDESKLRGSQGVSKGHIRVPGNSTSQKAITGRALTLTSVPPSCLQPLCYWSPCSRSWEVSLGPMTALKGGDVP